MFYPPAKKLWALDSEKPQIASLLFRQANSWRLASSCKHGKVDQGKAFLGFLLSCKFPFQSKKNDWFSILISIKSKKNECLKILAVSSWFFLRHSQSGPLFPLSLLVPLNVLCPELSRGSDACWNHHGCNGDSGTHQTFHLLFRICQIPCT